MARLHLFNPENDIALAAGTPNFTPPKAAHALRLSGSALPLWYAENGDRILCHGINDRWLSDMQRLFDIDVDVYDHTPNPTLIPSPWGWSNAVRREFINEGFDTGHLPSDTRLEQWRQLSHRRTAAVLRDAIAPELDFDIAPAAVEFSDSTSLTTWLGNHTSAILKSPWSSSGRGLIDTRHLQPGEVIRRAEGIIRRQGSVMAEIAYNRTADFAMLFVCNDGICRHIGYSLFTTDASGNYNGNYLASDSHLLVAIGQYYPAERLAAVAKAIESTLSKIIAPVYDGPLGVDMLTASMSDGSVLLDATVELNLRMTMGFVAHSLSRRYLAENSTGRFSISPSTTSKTTDPDNLVIENKHIVSGTMSLTPPGTQFTFTLQAKPTRTKQTRPENSDPVNY